MKVFKETRQEVKLAKVIYSINNGLDPNKNGTKKNISSLSHEVNSLVQNSNLLLEDFQILSDLIEL